MEVFTIRAIEHNNWVSFSVFLFFQMDVYQKKTNQSEESLRWLSLILRLVLFNFNPHEMSLCKKQ